MACIDEPLAATDKKELVVKLLEAKKQTGKTYTELAKELGLTNMYTAQLFQNQVCCSLSWLH